MSLISEQLTVCILAKNEEERIGKAVASVGDLGAKLLIIDAFSEDESFQAAREAWLEGGRDLVDFEFITRPWLGFVRTREESIKFVKTRWVLWLDADEWIQSDLQTWLQAHLEYLHPDQVYAFRRQSFFMGRQIRHGGWYPDFKARLCRVGHATWAQGRSDAQVHEDLKPTASQGVRVNIDAHIGHLPFRSYEEQRETNDNYSTLLAINLCEQWKGQSRKPDTKFFQHLKVGLKFLERYLWMGGLLDGEVGYHMAKGSAWSLQRRIEKARELYWTKS